jgi:hypothetical protein
MKKARQRHRKGSLREVPRANNKTAWEYRYINPATGMQDSMYLSTEEYPTRSAALARLDIFVRQLNSGHTLTSLGPKTFGGSWTLLSRASGCLKSRSFARARRT